MTPTRPVLLLPAALVDPAWLGDTRRAACAAAPGWAALARRAVQASEAGPDGPPPHDPGHERWLAERLGLPDGVALAGCSATADGRADAAWRLDAVHLHVGRDHLVLADPAELAIAPDEAHALADAIAPLFGDEGLALDAVHPARWYLHETDAARPLRLRTRALAGAIGRNVDAWLPTGADARRWRRLANEVQMTWHAHPVNAAREAAGRPAVNSLWIQGRCPAPGALAPARAEAATRIAAHADARDGTPLVLDALDGARLEVDGRLLEAHLAGDPQHWADVWRALDAAAFAPIARREGPWAGGATVVLAGDAGWRTLDVSSGVRWRFWDRPSPLALLAEPATADARAADTRAADTRAAG